MGEVRTADRADFYDAILFKLDSSANVVQSLAVSLGALEWNLWTASKNALVQSASDGGALYFSGRSVSYSTEYWSFVEGYDPDALISFVYKHRFGDAKSECLFT